MVGDSWIKARNTYINRTLGPDPYQTAPTDVDGRPIWSPELDAAHAEWQKQWDAAEGEWMQSLSPAQQQDVQQQFLQRQQSFDKSFKIGKGVTLGILGGIATGGLASGFGAAGGAGLTGVDAAMADLAASGGLTAGDFAAGAAGASGAGGGAGLLGGGGGTAGLSGLDAAALDMGAGATNVGAGTAAATAAGGSGMDSIIDKLVSQAGSMGLQDWLKTAAGAAALANSLKSPEAAQQPDFMALAKQQADAQNQLAQQQTQANRPNQVNAAGDTSTWTQDPVTGAWTQKQQFGAANQGLFDQTTALKGGLLGQAANAAPLSTEGLPELGGPLMDPRGNSTEIQQAWMNLLKPERDMARASEIQRLKNQGLTEDSPAFQRAMTRLDQGDTDAQNKALIHGTSEYGNIYGRDLSGRASQRSDSQTMFGQRQAVTDQPYRNLQNLTGSTPTNPIFGGFTSATGQQAPGLYGAGQDQYAADLAQANAKNAASNNLTQGLWSLAKPTPGP